MHCPHCPLTESSGNQHTFVCNCGHHHAEHTFAAGCRLCSCERYSQTLQRRSLNDPRFADGKRVQLLEVSNV